MSRSSQTQRNPRVKVWHSNYKNAISYRVIVNDRRTSTNMRMIAMFSTEEEANNYIKEMK
jgi:hypothetical protein